MDKKHNVNSIQTLYGQETQHIHHGNTIWTRNTTHTTWNTIWTRNTTPAAWKHFWTRNTTHKA